MLFYALSFYDTSTAFDCQFLHEESLSRLQFKRVECAHSRNVNEANAMLELWASRAGHMLANGLCRQLKLREAILIGALQVAD